MKLVLCAFEKLSDLKINFHKSGLFCFGLAKLRSKDLVELFGCKEENFPFCYLGIPMHFHRFLNKDGTLVEE